MNLVDCVVIEVYSEPYKKFGKWWVDISSDCYGVTCEGSIMFDSKEEADEVTIGYEFLG